MQLSRPLPLCGGALAALLAPLFALASPTPVRAQPGDVVFSEVMWSGSGASSADEWIELYNRGDAPVDLSGWTITRGDGDAETVMIVLEAAVLPPRGVFLIANYGADDDRSHLAVTPQLVDAGVSLPNTKLHLRLYDAVPETGRLVDQADDGKGAPLAGSGGETPASMVRVAFGLSGDVAEAWETSEMGTGWDAGAVELGTPGSVAGDAPQQPSTTSVAAASWAQLKRDRR